MREFFPTDDDSGGEEKPVDPFVKERHTGERVLETVKEVLENKEENRNLKESIKIHLRSAKTNGETWKRMIGRLPPEEKEVFEYVLAQELENFYYTHYNAVRNRLNPDQSTDQGLERK